MEDDTLYFEKLYEEDEQQFICLKLDYAELNQDNIGRASWIATTALVLADRWSEIAYQMTKLEKLGNPLSKAYKKRANEKYKTLMEIHTHTRVVWGRGEERVKNSR